MIDPLTFSIGIFFTIGCCLYLLLGLLDDKKGMKKWIEHHGQTLGLVIIIVAIGVVMFYLMGYENTICPLCS